MLLRTVYELTEEFHFYTLCSTFSTFRECVCIYNILQ